MSSPPCVLAPDCDLSGIGIYNAAYYDLNAMNGEVTNRQALQAAIDAAIAAGGGTVLIPDGIYKIEGPIFIGAGASPPDLQTALIITGTSGNTQLSVAGVSDLFDVATSVSNDAVSIVFQDLQIKCKNNQAGTAINVTEGRNIRLLRLSLLDFPVSVALANTACCSILECLVKCDGSPSGSTAVSVGEQGMCADTTITACVFHTGAENGSPPGGPSGMTGLFVQEVDGLNITNMRIEGFRQGIRIAPGSGSARRLHFSNVSVFTGSLDSDVGAALAIQPQLSAAVTEGDFVACEFGPVAGAVTAYELGGVYIDPAATAIVDQLRFVSCYSCAWPGPGLQMVGGTNVEILGGYYSCNGTLSQSPPSSMQAGIALTEPGSPPGNPLRVRITGVGCTNSVFGLDPINAPLPPTQEYGITVDVGATEIFVRDCDFSGNLSAAVLVEPGAGVQVTDCVGYNDQAAPLSLPIGSTFTNETLGYYGPLAFYVSTSTSLVVITIDGHNTGLSHGGFTLSPGESAKIAVSGTQPTIVAVGQ